MTRILCYHDVASIDDRHRVGFPGAVSARYKLTPQEFERHLDALEALGLRPGLLRQRPPVALTFDDGGASALGIAAALERRGFSATFLIVTARLGTRGFLSAGQVRELAARGHTIGSHSHTHPPYIERLAPDLLAEEWRTSRERLGDVLGALPHIAAVPGGRLSVTLLEQVEAAGYELLLSSEPTARERHYGRLSVRGRYMIWAATPPARAAAYARGDRVARARLRAQWRIKLAARATSPRVYERVRLARAAIGRSSRNEPGQPSGLDLKRRALGATEPGGDQPAAHPLVADDPLHGGSSGGGVAGLDQHRAGAERAHAANRSGDARQAAGVGLDQHLGKPLGARHVQEHVALPVQLEQASVERNVPPQLAVVGQSELLDPSPQLRGEVSFSTYEQPPAGIPLAEEREHVGQQQRVLFGIDAPDGQQRQPIAVVGAVGGLGAGGDVGRTDEGDRHVQHGGGVSVAAGDVWPDGDHRAGERERAPNGLEGPGRQLDQAVAGMAVADVGGEVLPHAEHEPAAPDERDRSESDRVRVRAKREDGFGVIKRPPHARESAGHGAQHRKDLREARIVRKRHELDRRVEPVVCGARAAVEAPEQPQPAALPGQRAKEAYERPLGENGAPTLAVEVVGVDDQRQDENPSAKRAAAPTVSVLIPVLNEGRVLERTVPTMLAQRVDGEIEFLFAEGRSRDDSRALLERFAARDRRVRVLDNPTGRTPDGLNIAFVHARGDFIARMDAHCFYRETYLADGIARLRRGDVAWVAGPAVPRADGGFSGTVALALCSPLGRGPSRRLARPDAAAQRECELDTGVFAGVWQRSVLARHGGWDPRWLRNQDSELAARFLKDGERIVSLPSMAAEYAPRRTLPAFIRQYHDYGRYRAMTLARHPLARRHSHALAPTLVGAMALSARGPRFVRAPARVAVGAYATAVAVETTRAARVAPLRDALGLPLAFVAMHVGWGVGLWRGFAAVWRSKQSFHQDKRG